MNHQAAMPQMLWFLLTPALVIVSHLVTPPLVAAAASTPVPTPPQLPAGCPSKCGDIDIPYPFGIGDDCSWPGMDDFTITCNLSFNPPRPYTGNIEVISISVEIGEMRVFTEISYICYNSSNTMESDKLDSWSLAPPFVMSPTRNVFTAIGCDTLAFLDGGTDNWNYFTGCISFCVSLNASALDGDLCTGLGCCQTSIPGKLDKIEVSWNTGKSLDKNSAWEYSPCSYAFVADKDWYNFSRRDLIVNGNESFSNRVGDRSAPLVLDWAIRGNGSCQLGPDSSGVLVIPTAPACVSTHSYCIDVNASQGDGYLCNCSKGYTGNPYITNGCTNINECTTSTNGPCGMYSTCEDTDGDYSCRCKFNRKGYGKSEQGCYQYIYPPDVIAALATIVAAILACLAIVLLMRRKQRKIFHKNGGNILKGLGISIFTEGELKTITNKYSERIGRGNFGEVYMGSIDVPKGKPEKVAVKRTVLKNVAHMRLLQKMFRPHEATQHKDDFVKEITFLFRIQHRNVVRLVGCCLETDVPILVFEYVNKESLDKVLHGAGDKHCTISLPKRLDIAIGSAKALSHMHTHGDGKHVHGDVKPANILLDDDLNPKVSDFGSSKLLSFGRYATADVAGDMRYIDPSYVQTGCFTVKSDVYSFGIVLLELITRKKARYGHNHNSLIRDFHKSWKNHRSGREMYDKEIFSDDDARSHCYMECLDTVGTLAMRCLNGDPDDRPTMSEVADELKRVQSIACGGSSSSEAT